MTNPANSFRVGTEIRPLEISKVKINVHNQKNNINKIGND